VYELRHGTGIALIPMSSVTTPSSKVSRHDRFQLTPGNRSNSCDILLLQTAKNFIN